MSDGLVPALLTLAVQLFIEVLRAVAWAGVFTAFYFAVKESGKA